MLLIALRKDAILFCELLLLEIGLYKYHSFEDCIYYTMLGLDWSITALWSPDIWAVEKVHRQRRFTNRLPVPLLQGLSYSNRVMKLGLQTLELCRLLCFVLVSCAR